MKMFHLSTVPQCFNSKTILTCWNKCFIGRGIHRASSTSVPKSPDPTFSRIYYFPYIRVCSAVNRLKLYQFACTAFGIPFSAVLQFTGIAPGSLFPMMCTGIAGCVSFYAAGGILTNVIGAMYVDKSGGSVKISYVDFWGQRTDAVCTVSDIGPLLEGGKGIMKRFHFVEVQPLKKYLKICVDNGVIEDLEEFDGVFYKEKINLQKIE